MLSRLGASDHQRVAATGDTVNAAHRLLEIAKQDGASVVVTEDLWQASSAADQATVKPGAPTAVEVRGRSHGLVIRTLEDAS
jgi:class 3 adenylate cyclase